MYIHDYSNKELYLLHEYLEKEHFKALYDQIEKEGYLIKDFIILSKKLILRRFLGAVKRRKNIFKSFKVMLMEYSKNLKLKCLKDKILIVGIAPYDNLMFKYKNIFRKNKCIYFTSWQSWDGTVFPKGEYKNKPEFEKILKNNFKACACVSKETERGIKQFFCHTEVVNHSINLKEYKNKEKCEKNKVTRFIFLGQFIERKNIAFILKWLEESSQLNCEFNFAGEGELREEIRDICYKDSRVNLLDKLSKEQIKSTLKHYDFLVLPSKEEAFGIVLIEALAVGVPCIVSDTLGPKEIITDMFNGLIFDKFKYDEFKNVMDKACNIENDEYSYLSNNCIKSSIKYDTSNIVKKWIKLLNRL